MYTWNACYDYFPSILLKNSTKNIRKNINDWDEPHTEKIYSIQSFLSVIVSRFIIVGISIVFQYSITLLVRKVFLLELFSFVFISYPLIFLLFTLLYDVTMWHSWFHPLYSIHPYYKRPVTLRYINRIRWWSIIAFILLQSAAKI